MKVSDQLEIHYYFDDHNKHWMSAFIKAKSDIELLAVIHELGEIFNISFEVRTEALSEGGLKEIYGFLSEFKSASMLMAIVGFIFSVYIYHDGAEARELDIEERKLSIEEKKLNIKKLRQELSSVNSEESARVLAKKILQVSPKIIAKRTNYFKHIQQQSDLSKISYTTIDTRNNIRSTERVIEREFFSQMIIEPRNPEPEQYEKIQIEVIAPILKHHNKAKWKGVFNDEIISFSLKDKTFSDRVFEGNVSFTSGMVLICDLEMQKKINEVGEEIITGYSVDLVHDYSNNIITANQNKKIIKTNKKVIPAQGELFG
ncbi:hypothetical protein [Acinetobacter sp. F16]|uniref:hypothetical protein n=1 Tax=Acinetobacter sp. F16 TaxID=3462438 RepID=UPI004046A601